MDIIQFLESKGCDLQRIGQGNEHIMLCPQCGKRKLSVNSSKNKFQCWRCGIGGGFEFLCKFLGIRTEQLSPDYRQLRLKQLKQIEKVPLTGAMELPEGTTILRRGKESFFQKKAYAYLNGRGITDEMIEKWSLGYCMEGDYAGYIIIPVPNESNQIRSFQARRFYGVGMKSKNPPGAEKCIFNLNYAKGHRTIVVEEGPFDAMVTHWLMTRNNISAVGLLGHTCSPLQAKIIANLKPDILYIALDPDISFEEANKMGGTFRAEGVEDVRICSPLKDPDELKQDDWTGDVLKNAKQCHYRKINYGN